MAYRHIIVTNPAQIRVQQHQLHIVTDQERRIPVEDILCLMLEHPQITISNGALAQLAEQGVLVFVCDGHHLPTAIFTPINGHSRRLAVLEKQLAQSKPYLKQLWQQIVRQKIGNQWRCLELVQGQGQGAALKQLDKEVHSGDSTNVEATAAMLYFPQLFGAHFIRRDGRLINGALNYGYSILRGLIARDLALYGFEPSLGIHHHNTQNAFNLADDLIEPFRPLVDLYVAQTIAQGDCDQELQPAQKQSLCQLVNMTILSGGESHVVHYAIERLVKSLSTCFNDNSNALVLPELLPLALHSYE